MMIDNLREHVYQGYTLIDITNTGITRYSVDRERERNQQRNWETVHQLLSLRAQVFDLKQVKLFEDLSQHEFGSTYQGKHAIWMFEFAVEFDGVYQIDDNPIGVLTQDFYSAPVILNLDETAQLPMPVFYTADENKNIYFKYLTK